MRTNLFLPGLMALAALLLAPAPGWCEESGPKEEPGPKKRQTLGEWIGQFGGRSLKIIVLPLDLLTPDQSPRENERAERVEEAVVENVSETPPKPAADADSAFLTRKREPLVPFLPATMVEGELTAKLDVNHEINRLRRMTAAEQTRSSRAPSSTLLAVLQENHQERARMLQEGIGTTQPTTMVASKTAPKPDAEPKKPAKSAKKPEKPAKPAKSGEQRQFVLLAMLDRGAKTRKPKPAPESKPERPADADTNATAAEDPAKGPKLAFLFARNPDRARTSRKSEPEAAETEPTSNKPIRQVTSSGRQLSFTAVTGPRAAPFHVFDVDPSETILIELDGGEVGRVHDQGKEWAWLQLDSGLMGVIRNKHVRPATRKEVMQFLAVESGSGGGRAAKDISIGVLDLNLDVRDLPGLISKSGKPLNGSVRPPPVNPERSGSPLKTRDGKD